jgi:hypothetical protein
MKKILLVLLVVVTAMSSCKKDKTTDPSATNQTSNTALPLKAVAYITNNYPDATIDYYFAVTNGSADYLVTLNTKEELAFNKTGDFIGKGENFHGGSAGDTIHGGGPHGGGIPIDSLPAVLKDYVAANFAGYTIRHAEYDSICFNGLVIEVMLFQTGIEPLKLYFEPSGIFLMRSDRMLYSDLPQVVTNFVTANYTGYTAANKAEKLTLAGGTLQYVVYLFKDSIQKSVRIDAAGTLICEQSGFHHGCPGGGHGGPGGGGPGGGGHPGGGHPGCGIPVDSLPAAIKDYITANYAGYTIRHARYDSICVNGRVIDVEISVTSGKAMVKLYFENSGAFLMLAGPIPYADCPQAVKDYIAANYAGYQVCEKPQKLTLADASNQYIIDLRYNHTKKSVRLDANGALICLR